MPELTSAEYAVLGDTQRTKNYKNYCMSEKSTDEHPDKAATNNVLDAETTPPDLDSREAIEHFINAFYAKVLQDELLAHIFLDVAGIDLHQHLGHIRQYWEKLLLGGTAYKRHTMNIHRNLHSKYPLKPEEFQRWLNLFVTTADEHFAGPKTERAKQVARHIASNMENALV